MWIEPHFHLRDWRTSFVFAERHNLSVGAGENRAKHFTRELNPPVLSVDIDSLCDVDAVANAENLPFSDREFHTVTCINVLEHVWRPWIVAAECSRVASNFVLLSSPFSWPFHEHPVDLFRFTCTGLASFLPENFWEIIEFGYYPGAKSGPAGGLSSGEQPESEKWNAWVLARRKEIRFEP